MFSTIKRGNLAEKVFEALRQDIVTGALKGGERLPPQDELASRFGVSRTVLREALNKLSSLGLVEAHQGRGTFICSASVGAVLSPMLSALLLDERSTRELLEVRFYLERVIARLVASRAEPEQLAGLRELVESMEHSVAERDLAGFARSDLAFHLALADLSDNSVFRRILEAIREMLFRFLEAFNQLPGAPESAVDYHRRIVAALSRRDPDAAEAEMKGHLLHVMGVMRDRYNYDLDV